jgi:ubiquinone biosynthesis protein
MGLFTNWTRRYKSFVRYNQIIRVFVKYGYEEMVGHIIATGKYRWLRRLIPKTTKKSAQEHTKWERMRLICEELGPTFVKFGQILSNRPDVLPEELVVQLERLQDHVPPLPGDVARKVVESELKNPVEELFAWFEPEAFASASMAQVHKATLKTGEKVAIKIQRPGIAEIIYEDIQVMYTLAEIFENRIPSIKSFDPMGLVKSFEDSIKKELDFIHESVNIQRFANHLKEDDSDRTTHAPVVHKTFTTGKVLTMEFISGIKISDIALLDLNGYDRKEIAKRLSVSYIKQVFEYGFFHADPHPGNILVLPGGHICFLDFGMMGSIMPRDIEMFGHLFLAVKAKDVKKIIRVLMQMSESSSVRDMRALEYAINEFVHSYSVTSLHKNEMSTVLLQLKDIVVDHELSVPSHFFLLARSLVTIEGVIHHIDPELDLLELARPYLVQAIAKKLNPFKLGQRVLNGLYEFANYMEEFPMDLKNAIRKINSGKIKADLTHKGIDPLVHTLNRITKQVLTTLLIAALLVGATQFIINKIEPMWFGYSRYGVIGIILALFLGYGMWRDLRKGDHDDWKGWDKYK